MNGGILAEIGIGASFFLSAIGSMLGTYISGTATVGAWKKCSLQNRPAPFVMVAFAGCPLTNMIYGFILMNQLASSEILSAFQLLYMGGIAGAILCGAALFQARCAAYAAEAFGETGQGFGNYIMVVGICETVGLFTMVFTMLFA